MYIEIKVPTDLFPMIAHAVKYFNSQITVVKWSWLQMEDKLYKDFSPMDICSKINDFTILRPSIMIAAEIAVNTEGKEYKINIGVTEERSVLTIGEVPIGSTD